MINSGFGMTDDAELLMLLNREFMQLSIRERRAMQLAVAAFAYAHMSDPFLRIKGLTMPEYEGIAKQILEEDARGMFAGIDATDGIRIFENLGGCARQKDIPGQYALTQTGDAAIRYMIKITGINDGRYN
jgi:hypothetical protein